MRFEEILIIFACLSSIVTNCQSVYNAVVNAIVADFNGDGLVDFLRQEKASWDDDDENTADVFLSKGDGTFTKVSLPEDYGIPGDLTNIYLGDFNGDGMTDFLRQEKGSWDDDDENTADVFLSKGDGTFTKVSLPEDYGIPGDLTNLYFGDFNGDGMTDFLRQEKGSWDDDDENTAHVFFSNGDGTFTKVSLPEDYGIPGDLTNIYLGDFNGDGLIDFLRQEKASWDDDDENTADVFLSKGDGTFTKVSLPEDYGIPGDLTNIYIGDFNGDGMADFFRQEKGTWDDDDENTAHVFFSNGDGTFTKVSLPEDYAIPGDLTNLYFGDFNGDSMTDFLRQEKGEWDDDDEYTAFIFFSNGDGTFKVVALPEDYGIPGDLTILHVADFSTGSGTNVLPAPAPRSTDISEAQKEFSFELLTHAVIELAAHAPVA